MKIEERNHRTNQRPEYRSLQIKENPNISKKKRANTPIPMSHFDAALESNVGDKDLTHY